MRNRLAFVSIGLLLAASTCLAQTPVSGSSPESDPSLGDQSPAENVRIGALQQRAPGLIIQAARARHRELQNARLAAQRSGDTSGLAPELLATGGTAGGLGDLLSGGLLGLLGGGSLTDLLGTLTGGTSTGGATTGGSTSGGNANPNIPSNLTPEVLALLEGAGININDLFPSGGTARSKDTTDVADAKADSRSQAVADQPKFLTRLADSLLSTIFTALVVGLQTPDFIDAIKDLLRPLLAPDTVEDAAASDARLRTVDHARYASALRYSQAPARSG